MSYSSYAIRTLTLVLTIVMTVALGACGKKQRSDGSAEGSSPVTDADIMSDSADSDSGKAMGLQTVHYAYDSSELDSRAKNVLRSNAEVLRDKQDLKIQIEGHTDERGGIQYNIALGERRANSARAYLIDMGVDPDRITTISYGKERPIDDGQGESAWAKNRRANFRITEK